MKSTAVMMDRGIAARMINDRRMFPRKRMMTRAVSPAAIAGVEAVYTGADLVAEDIGPELLREKNAAKLIPPLHGALLKNEQDVHLFERLAFLHRRGG